MYLLSKKNGSASASISGSFAQASLLKYYLPVLIGTLKIRGLPNQTAVTSTFLIVLTSLSYYVQHKPKPVLTAIHFIRFSLT